MSVPAHEFPAASPSSERKPPVHAVPPARHQATSGGVPSDQASAAVNRRLVAVAAPGRDDIVVLVDTSAMRVPCNSPPGHESEVVTSPTRHFLPREEETPQDERLCTQLWVLWAALTFPLMISAWLIFLPVLLGNTQNAAQSSAVNERTSTSSPPNTSRIAQSTTTLTWQGVAPNCLQPVDVPTPPLSLKIGPYPNGTVASGHRQRPIFCLFDNAKVTRVGPDYETPLQWNYLFETLPFALCPNVVYSSVGIDDGQLTSRVPHFDHDHGLQQLKNITESRGFPDTRIMLLLGGYRQDAPHFSKLGRDTGTLELLMRNVAKGMVDYRLDGVTVQWVTPSTGCSGSEDMLVLAILLRRLRETFNSYRLSQHIVSVILEIKAGSELLADSVADVVDYFFISTHAYYYKGPGPYLDICSTFNRPVHLVIANYTKVGSRVRLDQLCITESLAPRAAAGYELYPSGSWIEKAPVVPSTALYTGCHSTKFCRKDSGRASCIAHLSYPGPVGPQDRDTELFLVPTVNTLRSLVNFSGIASYTGPPTALHACVLVTDLDADNYANQCGPKYMQYVLMEHFYHGTLGQNILGGSISDAAPWCDIPKFG